MMLIFGIGEEAPFTHLGRASRYVGLFRASDIRLVKLLTLVARDIDLRTGPKSIGEKVRAHMLHRGAALCNCHRVLVSERFAPHFLVSDGTQEGEFEDHRRIGSKTPENVGDGAVQAGDNGTYANNG